MYGLIWFMVFNTTFNNISVIWWQSVLMVEETGVGLLAFKDLCIIWLSLLLTMNVTDEGLLFQKLVMYTRSDNKFLLSYISNY
jgi:hypothetical protein